MCLFVRLDSHSLCSFLLLLCMPQGRGPMDKYQCDIFAVICLSGYGCGEGIGIRWYRVAVS